MPPKRNNAKTSLNSVDALRQKLNKDYGNGFVVSDEVDTNIDWVSTGIPTLNRVLGGGFPRGRILEVFGPESSGKTSLTLHAIAKYQKRGYACAFVDAEYSFTKSWAQGFGVNTDDLLLLQPDCGEDALNSVEAMIKSNVMDLIVVDSVSALVPKAEVDGEVGASHVGLQARMMSQALRKLTGMIGKTKTTLIFINQIRTKIGVMFGNPETTSGGNALKFYCSQRIDVRRTGIIGSKESPKGITQKMKAIKNKCAPPFRETVLKLYYGRGYDVISDLFEQGLNCGIIEKSGAWYSYDGEKLGQGEEKSIKAIKADKEKLKGLMKAVKEFNEVGDEDED
jgi:recombination protein RecA